MLYSSLEGFHNVSFPETTQKIKHAFMQPTNHCNIILAKQNLYSILINIEAINFINKILP
jgi:hypothetical protein